MFENISKFQTQRKGVFPFSFNHPVTKTKQKFQFEREHQIIIIISNLYPRSQERPSRLVAATYFHFVYN